MVAAHVQSDNIGAVPSVLAGAPLQPVFVVGLEQSGRPLAQKVWQLLNRAVADPKSSQVCSLQQMHIENGQLQGRIPLHFTQITASHQLPAKKRPQAEAQQSVQQTPITGMVKSDWAEKVTYRVSAHCSFHSLLYVQVPAVVAVFFELEWSATDWQQSVQSLAQTLAQVIVLGKHR